MQFLPKFQIALLLLSGQLCLGQAITLIPAQAGGDDSAEVIFDAAFGNKELVGATKVYMHHGVVTDQANGTAWKYTKGNWGADDGIGLMTKVSGEANKWSIKLNPSIRSYFGVPSNQNIYRISCVFRNADGSKKGTSLPGEYGWGSVASNLDYYINLNSASYVQITAPSENEKFIDQGQFVSINAQSSVIATSLKLFLDEGNGYEEKISVSNEKNVSYNYQPTHSLLLKIKATALIGGTTVSNEKSLQIILKNQTIVEEVPMGLKSGVNYNSEDSTKATLVLLAPHKGFIYVVGDFNDWKIDSAFQMKKSPDGERFWLELKNLIPKKEYAYQYWIDGTIKVADPYTQKIADPWNDKYIASSVYPNLLNYNKTAFGIASVLQTQGSKYQWSDVEKDWQKPDGDQLVIYELLVRDFVKSHTYKEIIDSIAYLKSLGINAIELMPVSEFEGNDSWGYNPSFYFATDKYYGTKEDLKALIDVAHQHGMAVIMDIVLNHSFGQSPLLQMYYDAGANKPAIDNPWYNREYVGPYQWGYDFNHESPYTKQLVDDINAYWLREFHFDGFRFDFTKGFTNYSPNGSIEGFDQSRINIISRMASKLWEVDDDAYVILEHWAPANEELALSNKGMKMWRNKVYDFAQATIGNPTGSFNATDARTHVALFDSHDEERLAYNTITDGYSKEGYDIKNELIALERVKLAAAFFYLSPGPKLLWMFDELGYDVSINFNGRLGQKPLPWGQGGLGYYEDPLRKNIYKTYQGLLDIRNKIGAEKLSTATKKHQPSGDVRRLSFDTDDIDLVVVGNFGLSKNSISGQFSKKGWWYNYFSGDSIDVINVAQSFQLSPGEWQVFTSQKLSNGIEGAVAVYGNPVTITPSGFTADDEITITFDAKLASPRGSAGLVGSNKVYMQAGVILADAANNILTNNIGTGLDDGIGELESIGNDKWQIKIIPRDYFQINQDEDIYQIGMYFRDANNNNFGFGFRDAVIYFDVKSNEPIVTVVPENFTAETEITLTFNARQGNRELIGKNKVYMHSGVGTINTNDPAASAWNNVKGNWGLDDGVGLMQKVAGTTDKWQIKLTPKSYYGLADGKFPYWIAAVFRDAAGTVKGTGEPGPLQNGFIASNLDYFIKNAGTNGTAETLASKVKLFPNPFTEVIQLEGIKEKTSITLFGLDGAKIQGWEVFGNTQIDLSHLKLGVYILKINGEEEIVKKIVKLSK